jgi:hypothetical protein
MMDNIDIGNCEYPIREMERGMDMCIHDFGNHVN